MFEDMEANRLLYQSATTYQRVKHYNELKKPLKKADHYKSAFVTDYEKYYKEGGRRSNKLNDDLYKKLTGKTIEIKESRGKHNGSKKQYSRTSKRNKIK